MHDAAAGFEHISNFLRDPNLDEVANFVGNLCRRGFFDSGRVIVVSEEFWQPLGRFRRRQP